MNVMEITARVLTATPVADLGAALDINDNGRLGWPDALAWLFFATVGLLGVAVVVGTFFVGVAATVHGMARIGRGAWHGVHRLPREDQ
jgi:hypothetical protein